MLFPESEASDAQMNILIFRAGHLGDTLVALPAIRMIQAAYPEASIYLLYPKHQQKPYITPKDLLAPTRIFSGFIEYPFSDSLAGRLRASLKRVRLLLNLRSYRFSRVFHLEPSYKTIPQLRRDKFFFRLAGIDRQVTTLELRPSMSPTRPLEPIQHEADFFVHALHERGLPLLKSSVATMDLCLDAEDDTEFRRWLATQSGWGHENKPGVPVMRLIAVGTGAKMQSKRWGLERYREVLRRLIEKYDLCPVFFGGGEDAPIAQSMIRDLGRGMNACGELSLRGAARALKACLLYLGNDTGTMHLAVAAGIRCVAIFSARDYPGKWYPYGEGHRVHRVPVDCEGCMLVECIEQDRKCLKSIEADEVYASCVQVIES